VVGTERAEALAVDVVEHRSNRGQAVEGALV